MLHETCKHTLISQTGGVTLKDPSILKLFTVIARLCHSVVRIEFHVCCSATERLLYKLFIVPYDNKVELNRNHIGSLIHYLVSHAEVQLGQHWQRTFTAGNTATHNCTLIIWGRWRPGLHLFRWCEIEKRGKLAQSSCEVTVFSQSQDVDVLLRKTQCQKHRAMEGAVKYFVYSGKKTQHRMNAATAFSGLFGSLIRFLWCAIRTEASATRALFALWRAA